MADEEKKAGTAKLRKPKEVVGTNLRFRDASPDDAEWILSLRLDPQKNKYLSRTSADPEAQRKWLREYQDDPSQVYFVIESMEGERVGTVRLYDPQGDSFCWGSWILADNAPKSSAVESTLMVYAFGLACGFTASHFDVRKENDRVWSYHERFGATRIREEGDDYYYTIGEAEIRAAMEKYESRLPDGVRIRW